MRKLTIRPVVDPLSKIDVTHCIVGAIAEELWRRYGGNTHLNWIEAEQHLDRMIDEACAEAINVKNADCSNRETRKGARHYRNSHGGNRHGRNVSRRPTREAVVAPLAGTK